MCCEGWLVTISMFVSAHQGFHRNVKMTGKVQRTRTGWPWSVPDFHQDITTRFATVSEAGSLERTASTSRA